MRGCWLCEDLLQIVRGYGWPLLMIRSQEIVKEDAIEVVVVVMVGLLLGFAKMPFADLWMAELEIALDRLTSWD
jgi:hypothetical protein